LQLQHLLQGDTIIAPARHERRDRLRGYDQCANQRLGLAGLG
jgi:hypothetical protein